MDVLWWPSSGPLALGAYFNISMVFLLRSCQPRQPLTDTEAESARDTEDGNTNQQEADSASDSDDGDFSFSLNEAFNWLVGSGGRMEKENTQEESYGSSWWVEESTGDDCQDWIHADVDGSFMPASVLKIVVGFVVTLVLSVVVLRVLWKKLPERGKKKTLDRRSTGEENGNVIGDKDQTVSSIGAVAAGYSQQGAGPVTTGGVVGPTPKMPTVITLGAGSGDRRMSTLDGSSRSMANQLDSGQFLRATADHLSAQLDWVLGVGVGAYDPSSPSSPTALSPTASSLLTPRLMRKGSGSVNRRPRWGRTLTSLSSPPGSAAASDLSTPDSKATTLHLWRRVGETSKRMGWTPPHDLDLDVGSVHHDPRLSSVLQFYQQMCPVPPEQWSASCLMVDYLLTLLELELTSDLLPFKVQELRGFGSAQEATCIGRADRFNVMMLLRLPTCSEMTVYDCQTCDDLPAGRLVLGVKEGGGGGGGGGGTLSPLVRKDRVGEVFGSFLCAREVAKACQRVLTAAVDRLKLKHKGLLDGLPFTFHLDHYTDLQLRLDTRLLNGSSGLGLSEIRLRFTPAVRVSSEESHPLPPLYAVPLWDVDPGKKKADVDSAAGGGGRSRMHTSIILRGQNLARELQWRLNGCEVTGAFMTSAGQKLRGSGVTGGCQAVCQQVLRAAFSRCGKGALLSKGELPPAVLDAVVLFLLLESPPSSWTLSRLPDRLSDCVHFLRSAVQSCWMPGFMLHNPHLLKAMPALELLPLLKSGRQENLLAGFGSDEAETVLGFMEARLTETGLRRCVKDDYSTEMWEYEFFIFG